MSDGGASATAGARELGLDVVGAAPRARPYDGHRAAHPRAPRARPLRGHALHDGAARGLVPPRDAARRRAHASSRRRSATTRPEPEPRPGDGRLPRYTWRDATPSCARSSTRSAARLGGAYRVLVDANQHVDREAAARAGVGFYGKNTMLITRTHGSWVVLGTLVTAAELEPTPPLDADCGSCRLCIDACPTGALDEPGRLDATRCLSYWTQAPEPIPERVPRRARRAGLRLRHLPGRLPVEPRRRAAAGRRAARRRSRTSTSSTGSRPTARSSSTRYERLYVPRNDPRWLRRNALVALGNVGGAGARARSLERARAPTTTRCSREHARWALERLRERSG